MPFVPVRVLIADDEPLIADTLAMIFRLAGYEVECVYSGSAAVEAARRRPPQVFISDVIMPGMNGIETAVRVQGCVPRCAVILLSGEMGTTELLERAREQGFHFTTLAKPVPPALLLEKVRAALGPAAAAA